MMSVVAEGVVQTRYGGHFEPEIEDDWFSDRIADAFRKIIRY